MECLRKEFTCHCKEPLCTQRDTHSCWNQRRPQPNLKTRRPQMIKSIVRALLLACGIFCRRFLVGFKIETDAFIAFLLIQPSAHRKPTTYLTPNVDAKNRPEVAYMKVSLLHFTSTNSTYQAEAKPPSSCSRVIVCN